MSLTTDPWLDLVTALLLVATVWLAIFTGRLNAATVGLAKDTVDASKLADRHHQESLLPIVQWLGRANIFPPSGGSIELTFEGDLENVGPGPALNVVAELRIHTFLYDKATGNEFHLPTLAPGGSIPYKFSRALVGGNTAGAPFNRPLSFEVTLTYENVFGKVCRTIQKNPGGDNQTQTTYEAPDTAPRNSI
jgi:hypothetical protein